MSEPITPPVKTVEELQSEIVKLETDKQSLIGETQEIRKSRQEATEQVETLKELLKAATEKNNANPEDQKIEEVVRKALAQRDQQSATSNRKTAFDKFVSENKDYHPDNDAGGLKMAALEREFAGFNTSALVAEEDFVKVIGKAHALLRGTDTQRQIDPAQPESSLSNNPAQPHITQDKDLSDTEAKLIQRNGWTKERFLALKAKMPDMVEDMVRDVRTP